MSIYGTTYYVYGFDVQKCFEIGFDVPESLNVKKLVVRFKGK